MVRVAWPLFVAGLVILGVHYLPWPARSQSQDTYRANSSPAVTFTSAAAANGQSGPTEDPAPPAPKVHTKSQPLPVPEPQREFEPAPLPVPGPLPAPPLPQMKAKGHEPKPNMQPKQEQPSAGLPTWQETVEKVEKKLSESFKASAQTTGQTPVPPLGTVPPPAVTDAPPSPFAPPMTNDAPPPPGPKDPPPFPTPAAPPYVPVPIPMAPAPSQPAPHRDAGLPVPAPGVQPAEKSFYPDPSAETPHKKPKVVIGQVGAQAPNAPAGKPITSPWTFHLEIVDGKNVITAKVGKTVQFRVNCDTVDIQSPHGTIQAQGNVKVSSLGLEVLGEKMTIQLQEDAMILEGKAQMKCQRDGQEIDLRAERFTLRLSEIQAKTSTSQSPPPSPILSRPPIVDVSREFP